MYKSIVVSCDTYYYVLASETDIDDTYRFMSQLGFGRKTGIDIEGELPGVLPSRDWKRQRFAGERLPRGAPQVVSRATASRAGIGQGYNAFTPIQLAHAIAMIANDGVAYPPHLVKTHPQRRVPARSATSRASRRNTMALKPEHLAVIKKALVGVPIARAPAPRRSSRRAYMSGGKTGTAQVYSLKGEKYSAGKIDERLRDHAWFIAYAPADSTADRARGAGRERRLRCAGGGADRAAGHRLLRCSASETAGACAGGRDA